MEGSQGLSAKRLTPGKYGRVVSAPRRGARIPCTPPGCKRWWPAYRGLRSLRSLTPGYVSLHPSGVLNSYISYLIRSTFVAKC